MALISALALPGAAMGAAQLPSSEKMLNDYRRGLRPKMDPRNRLIIPALWIIKEFPKYASETYIVPDVVVIQ